MRLEVCLTRIPLEQSKHEFDNFETLKDDVKFVLNYHGRDGEDYYLEDSAVLEHNEKEYRAFGFAFEPMQANRIGRIKFRGYLRRRSDSTLHYVKMRLLCTSFSTVLDHSYIRNRCFMIRELISEDSLNNTVTDIGSILDDRQEQWSYLRGTIQIEQNPIDEIHFISTVGRRVFKPFSAIEKITHLWAYTQQGYGLYLGVIELTSGKAYRYGLMNLRNHKIQPLRDCSLKTDDLKDMLQNIGNSGCHPFTAKFDDDEAVDGVGDG